MNPKANIFLLLISPALTAFSGPDNFNDNSIDNGLWTPIDFGFDPARNQIAEENGEINFVFTGLGEFEEGFAGIRYQEGIGNAANFSIRIDLNNNITNTTGTEQPNLGILLESASGSGLLFFDLFSSSNYRIYIDDRGPPGSDIFLGDRPGISGGLTSTLELSYDSAQELVFYSATEGGMELFSESVGIGDTSGSLGIVAWGMSPTDQFNVSLFANTRGVNASLGELTMDNFSLTIVPEPKHSTILIGALAIVSALLKRRSRTLK